VLLQPDSPDHRLEIYTPNDASSADALHLLTRHIAGEDDSNIKGTEQPAAGRGHDRSVNNLAPRNT
jgi:hypothetical protein